MLSNIYKLKPLQRTYLTVTMGRVSRSFALVVPWLEDPLQDYVATAYLLCRTLDNIEDCTQSLAWQKERFAEFAQLLAEPEGAPALLAQWEGESWPGLSPDERALMTLEGGLPLWLIYSTFPARTRSIIKSWVLLMAKGMELILDPAQRPPVVVHENVRLLATAKAYNDYCYSVAGTVGGLGTELVIDHYGLSGSLADRLLSGSEACGRALQKTNILKDFVEDLERQICYLPNEWLREIDHRPLGLAGAPIGWIHDLLSDILGELRSATTYVLDVPRQAAGYRIACLICLLPAYETILRAAQRQTDLFTSGHQIKIARETMFQCIHSAVSLATDDDGIRNWSRNLEQETLDALQAEAVAL
ncbi:MAG: squalene/phytoene synthase family protein [Caldilineaceae bacterium]|nr:squalene/phytoene synthase family protein [Caldilineaceae bacterium]